MKPGFDDDAVVGLAQSLVRLPTVVGPGVTEVETAAAQLIGDTMREFGWAVTVEEVYSGRPNVEGS